MRARLALRGRRSRRARCAARPTVSSSRSRSWSKLPIERRRCARRAGRARVQHASVTACHWRSSLATIQSMTSCTCVSICCGRSATTLRSNSRLDARLVEQIEDAAEAQRLVEEGACRALSSSCSRLSTSARRNAELAPQVLAVERELARRSSSSAAKSSPQQRQPLADAVAVALERGASPTPSGLSELEPQPLAPRRGVSAR